MYEERLPYTFLFIGVRFGLAWYENLFLIAWWDFVS